MLFFRLTCGVSWVNAGIALIGSVVLFIGNTLVAVIVSGDLVDKVNNFGKYIGLLVSIGQKFITIT